MGRDPVGPQLSALRLEAPAGAAGGGFPFDVPAVASLEELAFTTPVTLLVGENGTGKSTLLEALAVAAQLPAVGSSRLDDDPTLEPQRRLSRALRLTWRGRTRRGFFLRAEDFFGHQKALARARAEHEAEMARLDVELASSSEYARRLAKGLMAIPDATVLTFDDGAIRPTAFEDLPPVRLVRDFLASPGRYLRHIWGDD